MEYIEEKELHKSIFGGIFLISNKLQNLGDKYLGELTAKQYFFMIVLDQYFLEESPTLTEVAEKFKSSRQNVKQIALKIESKGFITIKKDTNDSRVLRIQLTEEGRKYMKDNPELSDMFFQLIFKKYSYDELVKLNFSLSKLLKNLNDLDELKGEIF